MVKGHGCCRPAVASIFKEQTLECQGHRRLALKRLLRHILSRGELHPNNRDKKVVVGGRKVRQSLYNLIYFRGTFEALDQKACRLDRQIY